MLFTFTINKRFKSVYCHLGNERTEVLNVSVIPISKNISFKIKVKVDFSPLFVFSWLLMMQSRPFYQRLLMKELIWSHFIMLLWLKVIWELKVLC